MDAVRIAKMVSLVGALRRIPVARLLAVGEIVLLAREHLQKLEPAERHRFLELMRRGRGRPGNLTSAERAELASLLVKADPSQFARLAAQRISPVHVPKRTTRHKR